MAIDASMSLYQFLIAVRQDGQQLMTETGETTRYGKDKPFSYYFLVERTRYHFQIQPFNGVLLSYDSYD